MTSSAFALTVPPPSGGVVSVATIRAMAVRRAKVASADDAKKAGAFLRGVRSHIRETKGRYGKVRAGITKAMRDLKAMETEELQPWLDADALVAPALQAWMVADRERAAAEAKARLNAATANAQAQRQAQVGEILGAAAAAETPGQRKALQAQARQVAAAPLLPVPVRDAVPEPVKVEGVGLVQIWRAEVTDFPALVQAVAKGRVPLSALLPNQAWLDEQADALGRDLAIPGVTASNRPSLRTRGVA